MSEEELKHTKKALWKVAFAKHSVYRAIKTCDFLTANIKNADDPVASALVTAIFILYAKPFGDNDGVGAVSSKLARWDSPEQKNLHDMLLHGRNNFYAHSNATEQYHDKNVPVGVLLQLTVIARNMGDGTMELSTFIREPQLTLETVPQIKALCQELFKRFEAEEKKCLLRLNEIGFVFKPGENPIHVC